MKDFAVVIASVILGACLLAGAFAIAESIDRTAGELEGVSSKLAEMSRSLQASGRAAAPAPRPRRGPDPDRVHALNIEGAPSKGPAEASITIVEFSDFQCPYCARVVPTLQQVEQEYGDKVRFVFKHLPLSIHPKAPAAHAAAQAAHRQGKFWEMHDRLFAGQRELGPEQYITWAGEIGLDIDQFKADQASEDVKSAVDRDSREAATLGVTGTPGFFINGRFLSGAQPFSAFKRVIDAALAG